MSMVRVPLSGLISTAVILVLISQTEACSCTARPFQQSLNAHAGVYKIQIVDIIKQPKRQYFAIRVRDAFKGCSSRRRPILLLDTGVGRSCQIDLLKKGKTYLVMIREPSLIPRLAFCSTIFGEFRKLSWRKRRLLWRAKRNDRSCRRRRWRN